MSDALFEQYLALLLRWNARLNLTAIREPAEIWKRHFAECAFCAQQIAPRTGTLLDYGSGGGFPGIPISILRPEIRVTLAESQGKKAAFLREAVRTLGINAEVYAGRVEAMPAERQFEAVTLRAVDAMPQACREAARRVAPGGWMILFATESKRKALEALLPEFAWQSPVRIPGSEQQLLLIGSAAAKQKG